MSRPLVSFPDPMLTVVTVLRGLLADRTESFIAGWSVGTRIPFERSDDQQSLPYVLVRCDGTRVEYPVLSTADVRVTVWHGNEGDAIAFADLCQSLLLSYVGDSQVSVFLTATGPYSTTDNVSGFPLCSFSVVAKLRPTPILE